MKRKLLFPFMCIMALGCVSPLSAWDGPRTLSIRWGHTSLGVNETAPAYATGIFAGLAASLGPSVEVSLTGGLEITPRPARTGYLSAEVSVALLGELYRQGNYGGNGMNSFVSLALVATPYGEQRILSPTHLVLSFTPITLGNAMQGRRENFMKFGLAWDFRTLIDGGNPRFSILWNLFSMDSYLKGTWSDFR